EAPELLAVSQALAGLKAIEDTVASRIGSEWLPDFMSVRRTLGLIASVTDAALDEAQDTEAACSMDETPTPDDDEGLSARADLRPVVAGTWREAVIQTRDDALLALEKASLYFERYEPSHPRAEERRVGHA